MCISRPNIEPTPRHQHLINSILGCSIWFIPRESSSHQRLVLLLHLCYELVELSGFSPLHLITTTWCSPKLLMQLKSLITHQCPTMINVFFSLRSPHNSFLLLMSRGEYTLTTTIWAPLFFHTPSNPMNPHQNRSKRRYPLCFFFTCDFDYFLINFGTFCLPLLKALGSWNQAYKN